MKMQSTWNYTNSRRENYSNTNLFQCHLNKAQASVVNGWRITAIAVELHVKKKYVTLKWTNVSAETYTWKCAQRTDGPTVVCSYSAASISKRKTFAGYVCKMWRRQVLWANFFKSRLSLSYSKNSPPSLVPDGLSLFIRTHIERCNNLSKNTLPQPSLPSYTTQELHSYITISARPVIHAACESHLLNILSCETCVLKMRQTVESTPLPTVNKKMDHLISNGGWKTSLRCTPEINWGGLRFQRSVRLSSITERRTIGTKYATAVYEFRYGRTANVLLRRQRGIG